MSDRPVDDRKDPGCTPSPDLPSLDAVLASAARLQQIVPGAILVGGSAAAHHAGHRRSTDHDHVLSDLRDRFDTVLENLEALGDWSTARVSSGKIILGELGGIETGVRQMIRKRPLETETIDVSGRELVIPTASETLRIKAWLIVQRNQTRDYLDVAALSDHLGTATAAEALSGIDDYYSEPNGPGRVSTQVARQLANPQPRDPDVRDQLATYKGLEARWHDWATIRSALLAVATEMTR